jgi:hypothetical protein
MSLTGAACVSQVDGEATKANSPKYRGTVPQARDGVFRALSLGPGVNIGEQAERFLFQVSSVQESCRWRGADRSSQSKNACWAMPAMRIYWMGLKFKLASVEGGAEIDRFEAGQQELQLPPQRQSFCPRCSGQGFHGAKPSRSAWYQVHGVLRVLHQSGACRND